MIHTELHVKPNTSIGWLIFMQKEKMCLMWLWQYSITTGSWRQSNPVQQWVLPQKWRPTVADTSSSATTAIHTAPSHRTCIIKLIKSLRNCNSLFIIVWRYLEFLTWILTSSVLYDWRLEMLRARRTPKMGWQRWWTRFSYGVWCVAGRRPGASSTPFKKKVW